MFGFFKPSPEEEEDRARLLLTRRRFLFLGAAAAGAAILKPHMPVIAPQYFSWSDNNAQWADYPTIPKEVLEQQRIINGITNAHLATYYNREMLETLKKRLTHTRMVRTVHMPAPSNKQRLILTPYEIGR